MSSNEVTQLIHQWQAGDAAALDRLTPFIYDELKRLARGYMRSESAGHTLQATALVNEAFLKLSDAEIDYSNRSHFVATAARMMRRTLVDHARAKRNQKHGGGNVNSTLHEEFVADQNNTPAILEMDMALEKLEIKDARLAGAVELVFFGGLTYDQAADYLGIARTTFYEDLRFAKAWLKNEMQ
ncbi:MAG: sigma-70 family RNA polymerase sigma factor [Gammaproteobacteria bacterium]|nr:sigma-70 family RNA polymerase sigma factor [Gammaproteobacteria bacterium]